MAEMAADGGHCTLSYRTAQAAPPVPLQEISGSMLRGTIFALALVARLREHSSCSMMRCKTRCEPHVHCITSRVFLPPVLRALFIQRWCLGRPRRLTCIAPGAMQKEALQEHADKQTTCATRRNMYGKQV